MPCHVFSMGRNTTSAALCTGEKTSPAVERAPSMMPLPRRSKVISVMDASTSRTSVVRRWPRRWNTAVDRCLSALLAAEETGATQRVELLERLPRPDGHRLEGVGGDVDRHAGLVLQAEVEPGEEGAAPGDHDALFHDVGGELGWRLVERGLHGVDDGRGGLVDGLTHLARGDGDRLGQASDEVAATDLGGELLLE